MRDHFMSALLGKKSPQKDKKKDVENKGKIIIKKSVAEEKE